jgi:hypothetical protein
MSLTPTQIAALLDDDLDELFSEPTEDNSNQTDAPNVKSSEVLEELSEDEPTSETLSENRDATVTIQLSDEFGLQYGPLLSQGFRLRVPIAVLGTWEHPEYGPISFTTEDFADMMRNFNANVTGYEPPLFYGHPINRDTMEGAPAVAFLDRLYQLGDTLFGEFDAKPDAYYQVAEDYFRYSSAEIIRNAVSKENGESLGTLLVGCALTNRPFLTRMPRNVALTEVYSSCADLANTFVFSLTQTDKSPGSMITTQATSAQPETIEAPAVVNQPAAPASESFADPSQLASQLITLAQQVENQRLETEKAKASADEANQKLARQELASKLDKIEKLNLSQPVKDSFKAVITAGLPSEQEEAVFTALSEMSAQNAQLLTEQQGSQSDDTSDQNAEGSNVLDENPYAHIIQKHNQLSEQRQRSAQLY